MTRLVALAALVLAVGPAGATPLPLPNLVELPPASLEVQAVGPRDVLRFTSTVENLGTASLVVVSTRATTTAAFESVQLVGTRRLHKPSGVVLDEVVYRIARGVRP